MNLLPKLLNALAPAVRYLQDLTNKIAKAAREFADIVALQLSDVIDVMTDSIRGLIATMRPGIAIFAAVAKAYNDLIRATSLTRRWGGHGAWGWLVVSEPTASVAGALALPSARRKSGGVQDYINRAYTSAYQMGTSADPAKRSANTLDQILQWLRDQRKPGSAAKSTPDAVVNGMRGLFG